MRIIVLAVCVLTGLSACHSARKASSAVPESPAPAPNQLATSVYGEPMLLGRIDRKGLTSGAFAQWFDAEYTSYSVRAQELANVKAKLAGVDILVFMGTWCPDSQREVPRFYKILDYLQADERRLTVIAVDDHPDRRKTSPGGEEKGRNIEYVPTFIFLRNGAEIGRIIESPQVSLETDMAAILAK